MKTRLRILIHSQANADFLGCEFAYMHDHHYGSPMRLFERCATMPADTKFQGVFDSLLLLPPSFAGKERKDTTLEFGNTAFPLWLKGIETSLFTDDMTINLEINFADFDVSNNILATIGKINLLKFVWCSVIRSTSIALVSHDPITAALYEKHHGTLTAIVVGGLGWELLMPGKQSNNKERATPEEALRFWDMLLQQVGKEHWREWK